MEELEQTQPQNQTENQSQPEPSSPANAEPDMAALIAEAEHRGYIRGRNEQIDQLNLEASQSDDDSCPSFLAHIRPCFWD